MKLSTIQTLLCSVLLVSVPVKAADFSTNHPYLASSLFYSGPSLLSSAVISGIILLPLLIPAQIVVDSVQYSEKDKTTTIISHMISQDEQNLSYQGRMSP